MLPNQDFYIENKFPNIVKTGYKITSPLDPKYNCIGWAATDNVHWWEPDMSFQYYWPPTVPRNFTPQAFVLAYGSVGYTTCTDGSFEDNFEKIAIYIDKTTNRVLHAARQLNANTWTSKLGKGYDIEHALDGLNGSIYASPEIFMKRPLIQSSN